ncbi:MAG: TetR/AcrR family transcriptional regulator [Bacteroidota bacterium]|nr:TetR/AcrR family transcriptional regulator [Bacteroidota bacterium]
MNTRDRILDKALEMLNEKGLENVSTYDIARALQIRQSNITYYFPTKSHIINALGKRMVKEVDQPFEAFKPEEFSFAYFYQLADRVMQAHLRYRFLMLNYAPIITADRELNDYFVKVLEGRFAQFDGIIHLLDTNGYVRGEAMLPHSRNLLLMQNMIIIYWVQEGAIYNADKTDEEKRRHYLKLFFQTFVPYLTPKGEENLRPFMYVRL